MVLVPVSWVVVGETPGLLVTYTGHTGTISKPTEVFSSIPSPVQVLSQSGPKLRFETVNNLHSRIHAPTRGGSGPEG